MGTGDPVSVVETAFVPRGEKLALLTVIVFTGGVVKTGGRKVNSYCCGGGNPIFWLRRAVARASYCLCSAAEDY